MGLISSNFTHTSLYSWTYDDNVVEVFPIDQAPFPAGIPWLFFRREQLLTQTSDLIYSFILTSKESGHILAVFHCLPGLHEWVSPPLAPFGGVMPADCCDIHQLVFLLQCVRKWIVRMGGSALAIKTAPSCYDPHMHELCHLSYLAAGFSPNHSHSNHYIPITNQCFRQIIEPAEQRRLTKGKHYGLHVTMSYGLSGEGIENFLHQCYDARGYGIPTPPSQWARFADISPKNYLVWINRCGNEPVAMAAMVRVSDEVLYYFRSGYLPGYRALSPSVMLFEAAYEYCQKEKIRLLDLGISIDHLGRPKPSLSRFKENIGGVECLKMTYYASF